MKLLKFLLPKGRAPRTILAGPFAGIRLSLDLQSELLIWIGSYECETFADLRRLLHGCRSAIDLGAAKGDLSIHCLRQPGMQRVVAAEPLERERLAFAENLQLNGLTADPRLLLHPGFVGRGEPPLWRSLADLARDLPEPLFLKIDIDGPEAEVLADGRETLARKDCRLLIETHSPEAESGCLRLLNELGYEAKIIRNAWWRRVLPEHRPLPHNRWLTAWRPASA